jgi:hypothetical protein
MRRRIVWGLLLAGAGCASRSEEAIRAEFEAFVERTNACAADAECLVVSAGCPLGCWAAVHRENAPAVSQKARELIEEYEGGGRSCRYSCPPVGEPRCEQGRCAVTEAPGPDGGT